MTRHVPNLVLSFLAAIAARCGAIADPIAAVPLPRLRGFSFPEPEAALTARIGTMVDGTGSAESQEAFAAIHRHAWDLWTALTTPTAECYEGQNLRVFETWATPEDLLTPAPAGRWRRGMTDLRQIRMTRTEGLAGPQDRLIGFVKFDPVAAGHVRRQNLLNTGSLQAFLTGGSSDIPPFPAAALVVKAIYKIIDPATLVGGRYYALPAWSGPPTAPRVWGPADWPGCVWVDLQDGGAGNGAIDPTAAPDGSSRTDGTTYPLSAFIHASLSADDAAALNAELPGTNANAGDIALLVGMHVAGRETARWTWQTFWWAPAPDQPPLPSSAAAAAQRPPELRGAPRHYAMALAYSMSSPDQPLTGGNNNGRSVYAYNPWLEAAFSPADLPDSIPGFDPAGQPAANNYGVQTNCMSCHARATFNPANLATAPRLSGARYVDLQDPQFAGTLQTDFLWSIPRQAQSSPPSVFQTINPKVTMKARNVFSLRAAYLRVQLPSAMLIALLQRSPAARVVQTLGEFFADGPSAFVLKSAVASAAALGTVHTLAGATTYSLVATQASPLNLTTNVAMSPDGFTVTNTINTGSWVIAGQIPPGLEWTAVEGGNTLTGPGILDATSPGSDDGYGDITGGNSQTTPILSGTPTQPGTYNINLTAYEFGAASGLVSPTYTFTVTVADAVTPPSFTQSPSSATLAAGQSATFEVSATGTGTLTYQWYFNGAAIAGQTGTTLTLTNVQAANAGSYTCAATNSASTTTSAAATLTVTPTVPAFTAQPAEITLASGQTGSFFVAASGTEPFSYQWELNGAPIANANDPYLLVSNASSSNAGAYTCVVTNSAGPTTTPAATLTLSGSSDLGRLVNVSVRTNCGTGSANIVAGFVLGGSGNTGSSKSMLIRADGPELASFGVSGFLPDPSLDVFNTSGSSPVSVGQDAGWCSVPGNQTIVTNADNVVFAFPLTTNSASSAIVLSLPPAQYTENVTGVSSDTGIALAEVYDVTNASESYSPANPRLINVSARANVATGAGNLIAGFTIGGSTDKTVLVRGTGPGLAEFGLTGLLDQPTLAVYSTSGTDTLMASNTGWGGDPVLAAAANSVFAFAQSTASADCSLLVTLPPGTYTANLNSGDGTSGLALVEVYEVP